ncbi:hypothetical protein [Pseudoalteromonas denitrificans]|uniref:Uncharacterized protein n=1 Tax=Pseudoalteromonas denitrificans DSM 6059 TaxID=1123010 RepID=A0A1I1UVJ8_9GAMM|nr:hypothetical protein [Pseudoalteromonas denitrificans]SFD74786.1 hypothetical protein SAMN02745724_05346 [Pseudoalteromonas denitrificans DSM 6059]
MLELMEYNLWLQRTKAGITKPRSSALKNIDNKLKNYHLQGRTPKLRVEVSTAIEVWQEEKGATWKSSVRNTNGAVVDLIKQINNEFELTELDKTAIRYLEDHRRQYIVHLFQGREIKLSSKVYTVYEASTAVYQAGSVGSSAYTQARNLVNLILGNAATDPGMMALIKDILGKSLSDFIAQVTPGVGLAYSTSMTTYNGYLALSAAKSAHSIKNSHKGLLPGDPTAAFLAVKKLIERERNACAANAGTHAIEATAKAAGIFLDAGAATGTAASIIGMASRLLISLHLLKKDWDEMQAVKGIFQKPWEIDSSIFAKSPLLGCYFLLSADTWVIVNLICSDFGKPGYKYKVEQAVKNHLNPLMIVAGQCIVNHRMTLTGPVPKLTVEREDDLTQIAIRDAKLADKINSSLYNKLYNKVFSTQLEGYFK